MLIKLPYFISRPGKGKGWKVKFQRDGGKKMGIFFALGDKFRIPRGNPDLIFGLKSFSCGGEWEARRGEGFAVKIPGE